MTRQFAVLMFPFLPTFHVVHDKGVHTGIKAGMVIMINTPATLLPCFKATNHALK